MKGAAAVPPAAARVWGPDAKQGAFSLSFDNLGEAFELEQGTFPPGQVTGRHYTAIDTLPKLLRLLDGLACTYFIEASNVALYPAQIRAIHGAGHEVAMHAWRHENWGQQNAQRRQLLLRDSMDAFATLGIRPQGFRPPGGTMPAGALQQCLDCGLGYCSPLGAAGDTRIDDGLAVLPFAWHHVDSYMLNPKNRALRESQGDPADPFTLQAWEETVQRAVDLALTGKHVTIIFHALLFGADESQFAVLQSLVGKLRAEPRLWLARCADVSQWIRDR